MTAEGTLQPGAASTPALRIESGNPAPEEVAAVVAVLGVLGSSASSPPAPPRRSLWNAPARAARPPLAPGPGAWRGSALPR